MQEEESAAFVFLLFIAVFAIAGIWVVFIALNAALETSSEDYLLREEGRVVGGWSSIEVVYHFDLILLQEAGNCTAREANLLLAVSSGS